MKEKKGSNLFNTELTHFKGNNFTLDQRLLWLHPKQECDFCGELHELNTPTVFGRRKD